MNLRYIALSIVSSDSGIDKDFSRKFDFNAEFINNYLSKAVRKEKIETGVYNMIWVRLSSKISEPTIETSELFKCITIDLPFDKSSQERYLTMGIEERYEFYLSSLGRGYAIADTVCPVHPEILLRLHDAFRSGGYRNEWLFKKKRIKDYGITVVLDCVFTSFDFKLMLSVFDLKKNLKARGCIYQTYPDETFYDKTIRHLVITDKKLLITDFLDDDMFECELSDLANGIINSKCLYDHLLKYIYNEETKADFESLRW